METVSNNLAEKDKELSSVKRHYDKMQTLEADLKSGLANAGKLLEIETDIDDFENFIETFTSKINEMDEKIKNGTVESNQVENNQLTPGSMQI